MNDTNYQPLGNLQDLWSKPKRPSSWMYDAGSGTFDTVAPLPTYFIDASRIDTELKLLHWILHLSQKTWTDRIVIHDLILMVKMVHGIDPYSVHP